MLAANNAGIDTVYEVSGESELGIMQVVFPGSSRREAHGRSILTNRLRTMGEKIPWRRICNNDSFRPAEDHRLQIWLCRQFRGLSDAIRTFHSAR